MVFDNLSSLHLFFFVSSFIVVFISSFAAINLLSRIEGESLKNRFILIVSALVLGGGIWAMHFISMLGLHLGMNVSYNIGLVILSIVIILMSSIISFWLCWRNNRNKLYLFISSMTFGIGIAAMHFIGMLSMEMPAEISYDSLLFFISFVSAVSVPIIGFNFYFKYLNGKLSRKIIGSVLLGVAISFMHYTGMGAVKYTHYHGTTISPYHPSNQLIVGYAIAIVVLFIILVIIITAFMDERYTSKVKESEEHYRNLVEYSPMRIAIHNFGIITYMNPAGLQMLGVNSLNKIINRNILEFIHPDYHDMVKNRWETIREQNETVDLLEEKMIRLDNQIIDVEMKGIPINKGGERLVQIFFQDITDRKRAEKLVHQLAYQDPLTDLPNRRLFLDRLNEKLSDIKSTGEKLAVMFIDLDRFKKVNDTFGHHIGDLLLVQVAKSLTACVKKQDTVARLAGDEFTALLLIHHMEEAVEAANKMLAALSSPYIINGNEVQVTPSIGISISSTGNDNPETLIKQADMAMYQAKQKGKNNYQFYNSK